eukprot:3497915-Pyramimonas_sp.AAC.1
MLDVIRNFEAASIFEGWKCFRDARGGSDSDRRRLCEPWAGIVRLHKRPEITADGGISIHGHKTRVQATSRPDHVLPDFWNTVSKKERLAEKALAKDVVRARETRHNSAFRAWTR